MLKDYTSVSLKEENLSGQIDFNALFGRPGAVEIEIGSGKGTFLVNQSKNQPDVNFLGIEWASKFYRYAVDRIGRWGLNNVRIIRTDAKTFFPKFIADSSVDCVHIYFPDPWPKQRHHKRRFFDQQALIELLRCLKTGGKIQLATDHQGYFQQMEKVLAQFHDQIEKIDFISPAGAAENETVGTNFERKYIKELRPIFNISVRKL